MDIKDLKVGDILLFSPEKGSFISWAITFLTDAPVSHAAMFYNEKSRSIIEETPPQVKVNDAVERFKDREIHVRRLSDSRKLSLSPVIEKATSYLNEAEPYDNSGLYMVGLLLIYRKFSPNDLTQKVMVKILKKIAASVMRYIHEHQNPGKLPMVCSQFVAQCYANAGDKYRLKIENGVLRKMALMQGAGLSVLDQAMEIARNDKRTNLLTLSAPTLEMQSALSSSSEELCRDLKKAIESASDQTTPGITDDLMEALSQFALAQYSLSSDESRLQNTFQNDAIKVFQNLKDNENMFVFPGDLLNHCKNLMDVGTIK